MKFNESMPIYLQLMAKIKQDIISGQLEPGAKINSVRELASKFGVNPNTMQKAFAELEREEILHAERTAGRYVTKNKLLIESIRFKEARRITEAFIKQMKSLGYKEEEIIEFLPYSFKESE
ncbi:GntR family transcriptional regulator [Clostridium aminobutyricum]|uniref:GntR family transcriptional regulator n=2 Tax=Clostridium aminobutyricum TaxID=33953 RepID=A0A939D928_CLOAM|nr:GntR family transcriptional regulator [Clostridium aminobutyricum]